MAYKQIEDKREADRRWYHNNKIKRDIYKTRLRKDNCKFISEIKSNKGCKECGEKNPIVLDFHHLDPKKKEVEVSVLVTCSKARILREIAKCEVYCSNHHRILHHHFNLGNKLLDRYSTDERKKE